MNWRFGFLPERKFGKEENGKISNQEINFAVTRVNETSELERIKSDGNKFVSRAKHRIIVVYKS